MAARRTRSSMSSSSKMSISEEESQEESVQPKNQGKKRGRPTDKGKDLIESFIDKLSNEVLICIFKYLDVASRKAASLVCKRWLNVIFIPELCKDFPLTFIECLFRPRTEPFAVFNKSKPYRHFPCVTIGSLRETSFRFGTTQQDEARAINAITKVSAGTSHLKLLEGAPERIFECFPNLKVLEVDQISRPLQTQSLLNRDLSSKGPSLLSMPKSVTTLIVKTLENKKLNTVTYWAHIQTLKCKYFDVTTAKDAEPFVQLSNELKKVWDTPRTFGTTVKTSSNLLSGKLFTFEDINGLVVLNQPPDYNVLLKFPNLTDLTFKRKICFVFHQELKIDTIKNLKLEVTDLCDDCFENIIKSFANVEKFTATYDLSNHQMRLIFRSYPHLKKLETQINSLKKLTIIPTLNSGDSTDDEDDDEDDDYDSDSNTSEADHENLGIAALKDLEKLVLVDGPFNTEQAETTCLSLKVLSKWPSMPKLKKISLGRIMIDDSESETEYSRIFTHLIAQLPSVRHCHLRTQNLHDSILDKIAKGWPNLLSLKLENKEGWYSVYATNVIAHNCKQLQTLYCSSWRSAWERYNYEWYFFMFTQIPRLRSITLERESPRMSEGGNVHIIRTINYSIKRIRTVLKAEQRQFDEELEREYADFLF